MVRGDARGAFKSNDVTFHFSFSLYIRNVVHLALCLFELGPFVEKGCIYLWASLGPCILDAYETFLDMMLIYVRCTYLEYVIIIIISL